MCRETGKVKQEPIEWLSETPGYTKRFAWYVGKRCHASTIQEVAGELRMDWKTVKSLEKEYLAEKLRRAGPVDSEVIGIDELSIRTGHVYRIVVSDLKHKRPIWFGGKDRSEASMHDFYASLSTEQKQKIRLVVMDMWKAFEHAAAVHVPHAAILYDKFHVCAQLNEAMDKVRRQEYRKANEQERKFIKGQRYTLLSRKANLSVSGRKALQELMKVNKRLQTAYVLKEQFDQLWGYKRASWAKKFFNSWKESLKWQRLEPFEKFANMIDKHWEGIIASYKPENKVSLGYVEGLNNKIRVIQRKAYGLRDEEYLRLKVLTCTLPDFTE